MEKYCNGKECILLVEHEAKIAKAERTARRLCALILALILLIFASNLAWVLHKKSLEDETQYVTQNSEISSARADRKEVGG